MNWWIIEDALHDLKGHWIEYLRTFRRGLDVEGDELRIFASRECDADVALTLGAEPELPPSIWARISDGAPKWKKLWRVASHGIATWLSVSRLLRKNSNSPDIIFVPTVLVHHLFGWWLLLHGPLRKSRSKVLLFFPNTPAYLDDQDKPHWNPDPSAKLFAWLIRRCGRWVHQGKLILGAETEPMVRAMTALSGVPFQYLPHPVGSLSVARNAGQARPIIIRLGAYGAARYEKGSDLILEAAKRYLAENPDQRVRFSLQWIDDYSLPDGTKVTLDPELLASPQFEFIRGYFPEGGYEKQLQQTDVMLLPYRDAYRLRVSRVVIEAMQAGMPVITSKGTTLHQQARSHGVAIECDQDDAESLLKAIRAVVEDFPDLQAAAAKSVECSRRHFSARNFREILHDVLK